MRVKVFIKDTDVLQDAVSEAVYQELESHLPEDEREILAEKRIEKALNVASTWWEYGEYITVEFDTVAKTIRVVPVGENE